MKQSRGLHVLPFIKACLPIGAAPADPEELNIPVFEPLANGRLVTIEVIRVNGQKAPGRSLDEAVKGFSRYVAGEVHTVEGEPVELETDDEGLLAQSQIDSIVANSPCRGASDVTVLFIPGHSDDRARGQCVPQPNGSHVVVIRTNRISGSAPWLLNHEKWWQLVIMHELCHSLEVPSDKSHAWRGRHCTHPECVLYPRPDARSLLTAIIRLGPPLRLCRSCEREIRRVQEAAAGNLIGPEEPYELMRLLDGLVRLNPNNPRVYAKRAQVYHDRKEYDNAIRDLTGAIELSPENGAYYAYRGGLFDLADQMMRAISDYERCLQLNADSVPGLNNLAWILATSPDENLRDGPRAVELSRRACELNGWEKPSFLGTLAAAYAETGQFDRAAEYQEKAILLAEEEKTAEYRRSLELYRAGKPRREAPEHLARDDSCSQ